jgi:putative endonuclease
MTNDLARRVWEPKHDLVDGFTKKVRVRQLVWYPPEETAIAAIARERQLKKWKRAWKLRLIEETNPDWNDRYDEIVQ